MNRNINLQFLLAASLLTFSACSHADKRSRVEKDSIANDTSVNNRVGGVETYETKLDERAADYLKKITLHLLLEKSAAQKAFSSEDPQLKSLGKEILATNTASLKKLNQYAEEKRILLPTSVAGPDEPASKKILAAKPADLRGQILPYLKANADQTLTLYMEALENREQDFKALMSASVFGQKKKISQIQQVQEQAKNK